MKITQLLYFTKRGDWREWLKENHKKAKEIWLVFYTKVSGKPRISYEDAVEEALCWGWIDTTVKKLSKDKFVQRFVDRDPKSVWSLLNKNRAEKMIKEGKMTKAGMEKIEAAKKSGFWEAAYTLRTKVLIPSDLEKALKSSKKAWENFNKFADGYRNMYIGWVNDAKRKETRERRINRVVEQAERNKKLLM